MSAVNMSGLKLLILTEAGVGIGGGHMVRCQAWQRGFEERGVIVTQNTYYNGQNDAWFEEKSRLSLIKMCRHADIVLVDSYLASAETIDLIAQVSKKVIFLDDYKRFNYPRGYVINGAIEAATLQYPMQDNVTYLLGHAFCILRQEFWSQANKVVQNDVTHILFTFGAADGKLMTRRIVKKAQEIFPLLNLMVVLGEFNQDLMVRQDLISQHISFYEKCNASQMKALMCQADILVCAGGGTLNEAASVGVPPVVVATADNQQLNIAGWQQAEFVYNAGRFDDPHIADKVIAGIKKSFPYEERLKRNCIGKSMIDGQGIRRAVDRILGDK